MKNPKKWKFHLKMVKKWSKMTQFWPKWSRSQVQSSALEWGQSGIAFQTFFMVRLDHERSYFKIEKSSRFFNLLECVSVLNHQIKRGAFQTPLFGQNGQNRPLGSIFDLKTWPWSIFMIKIFRFWSKIGQNGPLGPFWPFWSFSPSAKSQFFSEERKFLKNLRNFFLENSRGLGFPDFSHFWEIFSRAW